MSTSVRPETRGEQIRRRVAALRAQGATEHDIETYLTQHEGLAPEPAQPSQGETPLIGRIAGGVSNAVQHIVTDPVGTARDMIAAPIKSAYDAVLSPSIGEDRPDPRMGKGGNSAGLPLKRGQYDAAHGAVTGKERLVAGGQTVANVLFPGIAKGAAAGAEMLGAGRLVKAGVGLAAAGGTAGAAYSPDDPLAGAAAGAVLAPALGALFHGAGRAGSAALDRTGLRPMVRGVRPPEPPPESPPPKGTAPRPIGPFPSSDPALHDPLNREILERPEFIRFQNRPGRGGVAKTGPFIRNAEARPAPDVAPESPAQEPATVPTADAEATQATPNRATQRHESARTPAGALRPVHRVSDDGLVREYGEQVAKIQEYEQRGLYRYTQDDNLHSTSDGRTVVAASRSGSGATDQAKAAVNKRNAIGVLNKIETELQRRGLSASPEEVLSRYEQMLERSGMASDAGDTEFAPWGKVDFSNPSKTGGGIQNRSTRGGVQQTGPFIGGPRTGMVDPGKIALLRRLGIGLATEGERQGPRSQLPAGAEGAEALTRLGLTRVAGGPSQGMGSPGYVHVGATRIFEPLGAVSDALPRVASMQERARDAMVKALEDKGLPPAEALAQHDANVAAGNRHGTLVELGGDPMRRTARTFRGASAKAGSAIDEALVGRAETAQDRIVRDAIETAGIGDRKSASLSRHEFIDQRAADAEKGYAPAFADKTPIVDERLQSVLKTPAGKSAWKRALVMMENDGVEVPTSSAEPAPPPDVSPADWSNTLRLMRERGIPIPEGETLPTPTLQQAHYLKLALDDLSKPGMERGPGAGGLAYNEAKTVKGVQKKLLAVMDEHSEAYKSARAKYADQSALANASDLGEQLWRMHPDDWKYEINKLGSQAEKDVARRTAFDAMLTKMESGPENPTKGLNKGLDKAQRESLSLNQKRMRALFPDDASFQRYRQRVASMADEFTSKDFVSGGSQTAEKLADFLRVLDVAHGLSSPAKLLRTLATARGKVSSARLAESGAPDLIRGATGNPDDLRALLEDLSRRYQQDVSRGNRNAPFVRALAAGAGAQTGRKP